MKGREEIVHWKRHDKRITKNKHTVITSLDGKKQYQLMGTLDEEESNALQQQLGVSLKGKVILGTGQFGKVRLVRDEEGTFFAVKKIKSPVEMTKSNFDAQALQREDQFNEILREKNISGVMRAIDAFSTTDSQDKTVMFQIMPIANLRDGENFRKLQSLLESGMNNKPELFVDLIQQLESFSSSIEGESVIKDEKHNEKQAGSEEASETADADLLESSDEEHDADLLASSDEEHDADLLESSDEEQDGELLESSDEEIDGGVEAVSKKSAPNPSDLFAKVILFHMTHSLVKTVNEMHQNGIYHRDIHGKNILFDGKGRIYLSDFGTGIAYGKDTVQVTSKLQSDILPPEAKFPNDKKLQQEFRKGSQASQQSIDQWELGCTLLSFITPEPTELLKELKMPLREIQKTSFTGKGTQYQNYVSYLDRKLEKFDKEVLSTMEMHPSVRKVILGLLNPDYKKRMSLEQAANIMSGAKLPNDEIISTAFHALVQYQAKQENKLESQNRFFTDTKQSDAQPTPFTLTIK